MRKGGEDLEREEEWGTVAGLLPAKGVRQGDTLYRGEGCGLMLREWQP